MRLTPLQNKILLLRCNSRRWLRHQKPCGYTLRYLRDSQLQRNVHRSQNRIESYHQLRSVITKVSGKKELIGHSELDIAVGNECGRLLANIVIAYNSVLLSTLLDRFQAVGDLKALAKLKKISPVAWQHTHFLGHYAFRDKHKIEERSPRFAKKTLQHSNASQHALGLR